MDKTDKYIDDLFRKNFTGVGPTIPPSGGDWLQLSKIIRKKNFLRFSLGSFNVFYLTIAAVVVTTVGSFILSGLIHNDKNELQLKPSAIQLTDTLPKSDTLTERADSNLNLKLESSKTTCCGKKSKCKSVKVETEVDNSVQPNKVEKGIVNDETTIKLIDSLSKTTENINPGEDVKRIENNNLNRVTPADTVVKIDTIHIRKNGVQFIRKKDAF